MQDISAVQAAWAINALPVDERAVDAARIAHPQLVLVRVDFGMTAGNLRQSQTQMATFLAADDERQRRKLNDPNPPLIGETLQIPSPLLGWVSLLGHRYGTSRFELFIIENTIDLPL
jgi:hypothetical protein